tara:strand:+ start:1721 stop:5491 length:3771 start_codon:yes stop_codon:yes gene_type:complete
MTGYVPDGLSNDEITRILFKNYMNFASSSRNFRFFEDGNIANKTNIFASSVMKDTPTTSPNFRQATNSEVLNIFSDFNIDASWIAQKTSEGGKFEVDPSDASIIRMSKIKLDWADNNSDAFYCTDYSGVNILSHLIPFNYGGIESYDSFSIDLNYKHMSGDNSGTLLSIQWLTELADIQQDVNETIGWGAPLFDIKNGVITFYDTINSGSNVFAPTDESGNLLPAPTFYLSATKYVGAFGVGTTTTGTTISGGVWNQDAVTLDISYGQGNVIIEKNLDVSGQLDVSAAIVQNRLDVMGDVSLNGRVDISGSFYVNGVEISGNAVNGGGNWNNTGDNTTTGNLSVDGNLTVDGNIYAETNRQVATQEWVLDRGYSTTTSGGGGGGGAAGVSVTTRKTLDPIDTASDISDNQNEYKTVHRSSQPPSLVMKTGGGEKTEGTSDFSIYWDYFQNRFVDAYDGRVYPLSFQTFVDVSFTLQDGVTTSGGYKNLYIGEGTYDFSGNEATELTSLTIPNSGFTASNVTGSDIYFYGKPDPFETVDIPSFLSGSVFDFKIYAINQSQTAQPRYIEILGVGLKSTGPPGAVTIDTFRNFNQNDFTMDFSFNLDRDDHTTTTGIKITDYDISFNLNTSKSLVVPTHTDSKEISGSDLSKTGILLDNLHPGAIYDVQVRAENETSTSVGYYGPVSNSTTYTNTGITDQYIGYTDLVAVSPGGLQFSLNNSLANTHCCINGLSSNAVSRTITNSYSSINVTGTSSFYVNFGKQGTTMTALTSGTNMVTFVVEKKKQQLSGGSYSYASGEPSSTMNLVSLDPTTPSGSLTTSTVGNFTFGCSDYTDAYDTGTSKNAGFVYKSEITLGSTSSDFISEFPAGTNIYNYQYEITADSNTAKSLKNSVTSANDDTGDFVVDDYSSTPTINTTISPVITIGTSSMLFGVPSILTLNLNATMEISNFASYIIPHSSSSVHSFTTAINPSYGSAFASHTKTNVNNLNAYDLIVSKGSTVTAGTYFDYANNKHTLTTNVYYLDNTGPGAPSRSTENAYPTVNATGFTEIFRDSTTTAPSGRDMYQITAGETFVQITNTTTDAVTERSLLYFNGKWVSGGYTSSIGGIKPLQKNWSTVHNNGKNYSGYSTQGLNGYKWIVFDVTDKKISAGRINLSNLRVDGNVVTRQTFGSTYKAYLATKGDNDNDTVRFGSFKTQYGNSGNWINSMHTTMAAADDAAGVWISSSISELLINQSKPLWSYYLVVGLTTSSTSYVTFS